MSRRRLISVQTEIARIADRPTRAEVVREHPETGRVQLVAWELTWLEAVTLATVQTRAGGEALVYGKVEFGWKYRARSNGR